MMKFFKNIKSFFPKNSEETKKITLKCSKLNGPAFISLKTDKKLNDWQNFMYNYLRYKQ